MVKQFRYLYLTITIMLMLALAQLFSDSGNGIIKIYLYLVVIVNTYTFSIFILTILFTLLKKEHTFSTFAFIVQIYWIAGLSAIYFTEGTSKIFWSALIFPFIGLIATIISKGIQYIKLKALKS